MAQRIVSRWLAVVALASGLSAGGLSSSWLSAQIAYPMLMSLSPTAAQIGTTSEHTVRSRYSLQGAYQVLVSGDGVRVDIIPPEPVDPKAKPGSGETLNVKIHVDQQAIPGVRDIHVATPRGVSTVGQLVIVSEPIVTEADGNDTVGSAQTITVPAVVCGRIEKNEDVDLYRFHVEAGVQLTLHTRCMRLQDRIHDLQTHADPILTLRDSQGSVIASADNTLAGDPVIMHSFDRSGEYVLEIRDVRYQGNQYWEYCVEITERPVASCLFPLAVAHNAASSDRDPISSETSMELIPLQTAGASRESLGMVTLAAQNSRALSALPAQIVQWPVVEASGQRHSLPVVFTHLPIHTEHAADNNQPALAQAITPPCVVNGRIEQESDVDYYRFTSSRGQRWSIEVLARRAGSSLDSHVRLLDAKGNQLQLADDMRLGKRNYADSVIENWTAPADGDYTIEVRDLHLRGGPDFVYALQVAPAQEHFLLYADTDKTPIHPGAPGVLFVRAERKNGFEAGIQLAVRGVPEGVTAHCGRILPGKATDGCIVLEAAQGLRPLVAPIEIYGTAIRQGDSAESADSEVVATVYQEIYQPGGGRGHWPVISHVIAVAEPGDIHQVKLSQSDIVLKPGQSQTVDVELLRAEGFDKNVTLEMTYSHLNTIYGSSLPEGVTIDAKSSTTLLTGGATKGKIVLTAAANAPPVARQQAVVMANVSLNFVMKATYASSPVMITVQ